MTWTGGDSAISSPKRLAVFVHGFGSAAACWDGLLGLLSADRSVREAFDLQRFTYDTRWTNVSPKRRIARLTECAGELGAFLDKGEFARYRSITLVGHSLGGLVIQQYLADKVGSGRAHHLARIRQVILIATPHFGSPFLSGLRKVISYIFSNPQERSLRHFTPEMRDVHALVRERIEDAPGKGANAWPVSFQCFWGSQDGIVGEVSARGLFHSENSAPLEGDHFTVITPRGHDDERYKRLAGALLEPIGHSSVHEIALFEQLVKVEPLPPLTPLSARYGDRERPIETDNRAEVIRRVTFSRKQRCQAVFALRYKTKNDGYIVPTMSHRNEAPPEEAAEYEDRGTEVVFKFPPTPGDTYRLKVDVYKGFDKGHRDIHFHLGTDRYCQRFRVRLDIAAYLGAAWTVAQEPTLFFHEHEPEDHQMCAQRGLGTIVPCLEQDPRGVFEWDLRDLGGGVLDLIWDVAGPPAASDVPASPDA